MTFDKKSLKVENKAVIHVSGYCIPLLSKEYYCDMWKPNTINLSFIIQKVRKCPKRRSIVQIAHAKKGRRVMLKYRNDETNLSISIIYFYLNVYN